MRIQAQRFDRVLNSAGCAAEAFVVPNEDHYGQIFDIAEPSDPLGQRRVEFIHQAVNPSGH